MYGGTRVRRAVAVMLATAGLTVAGPVGGGMAGAAPSVAGGAGGVAQADDPSGEFTGLTPRRILDTRSGLGTPDGKYRLLGTQETMSVQVTGRGGVPATGVSAVVLNATIPTPAGPSYLSVWPTGRPRPNVSNLNWERVPRSPTW